MSRNAGFNQSAEGGIGGGVQSVSYTRDARFQEEGGGGGGRREEEEADEGVPSTSRATGCDRRISSPILQDGVDRLNYS